MSGFDLKDYVTVAERLGAFYEKYPDGSIQCDIVELNERRVVMRATVYRTADDQRPSIAHSSLGIPGATPYTKGSEIENAETSAAGRAIAMMGFEVKRGIATAEEVQNKAGAPTGATETPAPARSGAPVREELVRETARDGLIGEATTQGSQDYSLRETPTGHMLPFRIKDGKSSQIVVAEDALALALLPLRDDVLGKRVTVWGHYTRETLPKDGRDIVFNVLHLTRIQTPDWTLPMQEAETVPLFELDEAERLAVAGSLK